MTNACAQVVGRDGLDALIASLRAAGREVLGPRAQDGGVAFSPVTSTADLPVGLQDESAPGRFRLVPRGDDALFGVTVGAGSARAHLQRPRETLFHTTAQAQGGKRTLRIVQDAPTPTPRALFGVRPCDVAAVSIQDRVLKDGAHPDAHYAAARADLVVIAASCTRSAPTCFCVSAGGHPRAQRGFDIALTELPRADGGFDYLVDVGTDAGAALLADIPTRAATDDERDRARALTDDAARNQQRALPADVALRLKEQLDSPRFDEVAAACLSCASCTLVCPTCFCTTTEDHASLDGATSSRTRRWESCFTESHSYMHGGAVRQSTAQRYRQWLTHKLSTWHDQFATAGCTGCGRCTTWCPVGIDFVKNAHRIVDAGDATNATHVTNEEA